MTPKDVISTLDDLLHLGQVLVKSGMLPASIRTPEAAVAIILKGREIGMPVMESFALINVIQGKPTVAPQGMLALINRSRQLEEMLVNDDGDKCIVTMKRRGHQTPYIASFSMAEAEAMGLDKKDNWKKQPKIMRQWRAISACARVAFPDVIGGMYLPEELGADVNEEGEIIVQSEISKLAGAIMDGQQHPPVDGENSNTIVINGLSVPPHAPITTKVASSSNKWWMKNIVDTPAFQHNLKFIRAHYDNHLKAHFGKTTGAELTGEELKALYNHLHGFGDDPRWYTPPGEKQASWSETEGGTPALTLDESLSRLNLTPVYEQWRKALVVTPEDDDKLRGVTQQALEWVKLENIDVSTDEGLVELEKQIKLAMRPTAEK